LESIDETVVIRTLDIGGDKILSYYKFPEELNPFLGYRAIRFQLDNIENLKTQARALLRASAYGKLAINIPMISTIEEFLKVKEIFKEVEQELKQESIEFGKYQLGIMVESPASVMLADKFIKHADFFSIGSNDLIQYTFAADRMNANVSYLYQPLNPALLKMIKMTIDASHNENK
jgi:phosphotransferase system enzyme I (PtsI)